MALHQIGVFSLAFVTSPRAAADGAKMTASLAPWQPCALLIPANTETVVGFLLNQESQRWNGNNATMR